MSILNGKTWVLIFAGIIAPQILFASDINTKALQEGPDGDVHFKSLYQQGALAYQNSKMVEAMFYLSQVMNGAQNTAGVYLKEASDLYKKAEAQFAKYIANFKILQATPVWETMQQCLDNLRSLGLTYTGRAPEPSGRLPFSTAINTFLELHWEQKNWVPMNRWEHPQKLASLMGQGKRIATVIVHPMPFHLAESFDEVRIYDLSPEQIEFSNNLLLSMKEKRLKLFLFDQKEKFKKYIIANEHERREGLPTGHTIDEQFSYIYNKFEDLEAPLNITAQQNDIFKAVNNESLDARH